MTRNSPIKHQVREHQRRIDGQLTTVRQYPRGSGERAKKKKLVKRMNRPPTISVNVLFDDDSTDFAFETMSIHNALDLTFTQIDRRPRKITMVSLNE